MNYLRPELLDRLAGAHALGTLSPRAARRFEAVLRDSREARAAVTAWQEKLNQLAVSVPPVQPRPAVWQAIQRRIAPTPQRRRQPWWWPLLGAAFGVVMAVGIVRQQPEWVGITPESGETLAPAYVGILTNEANEPVVLASSLRHGKVLTLKMLKPVKPPEGQVARLWAIPSDGRPPFALGTVPAGSKARLELTATSEALFSKVGRLAVSFEPPGGGDQPGGPFVLSGHCVKVWEALPPASKPAGS
ncbi:anti-sigma factor [Roseateles sp. NT4]|uniref:anti-sigma factor n=1 Tax=Roseateles sp. NT4 TaxID=3453715 RepID=UPI003EEC0834